MAETDIEIWEMTIPGTVSMVVIAYGGKERRIEVSGKGTRLRIAPADREYVEEQVRLAQNNPFRNGMLIPANDTARGGAPADDQLSDEDLQSMFALTGDDFEGAVKALSEVNVRRLKDMIDAVDASKSQMEFLTDYIAEAYPIGGDTAVNAELRAARTGDR